MKLIGEKFLNNISQNISKISPIEYYKIDQRLHHENLTR